MIAHLNVSQSIVSKKKVTRFIDIAFINFLKITTTYIGLVIHTHIYRKLLMCIYTCMCVGIEMHVYIICVCLRLYFGIMR